ncbi:MAG: thymidylate synthase [Robiginitomaculum sp.]|nr:MAG: thymidylate synthase [Robiginitomaculum sp.]
MKQYLDSLNEIIANGTDRSNRTGVDTRAIFGYQMRFNLQDGFPAVTTKKLAWKAVVGELLWFLEGSTDERRLAELTYDTWRHRLKDKKTIWTANAEDYGMKNMLYRNWDSMQLGPVYGKQWRDFGGFDQIAYVADQIKNNPESRRIIMSSWNPPEISQMALPPCHIMAQFNVHDGMLDCMMTQRSADMFLGVPFNIASYALLTHILADYAGLAVGEFVMSLGDAHIYHTHFAAVNEQLNRKPAVLPTLELPNITSLDKNKILEYSVSDFTLENYKPMSSISAPMAV